MNLPDFNNFLFTLNEENVVKWTDNITNQNITYKLPLTEENSGDFAVAWASVSILLCKEMLREYHEWLCQNLKD